MNTRKGNVRHSWIAWDGKIVRTKAKCMRCGIIREYESNGKTIYSKHGVQLPENPLCVDANNSYQ